MIQRSQWIIDENGVLGPYLAYISNPTRFGSDLHAFVKGRPLLTANLLRATPDTMFALEKKALQHSLELVDLRAPLRVQPKLDNGCIDREADPERDAEELAGPEMRAGTGGEEYSHDGTSGCDT